MSIQLFKKAKTVDLIYLFADLAFVFCIVSNTLSAHNRIGQIGLVLFGISVFILVVLKRGFWIDRFFLGYGAFIIWGLIGVVAGWACDKSQAFAMVKTLVIDFGFMFLVYQYLKGRESLDKALMAYMLAAIITIVLVFILSGPKWKYYRLGQRAKVNPNKLADMLLLAWSGAVYLFFNKKRKIMIAPALVFFIAIILTGSRQGILGFSVFTVVYVLWTDKKHIVRNILVLFAMVAAACAILFLIPYFYKSIGMRLLNTIKGFLGLSNNIELSISQRRGFSEAAVRLFRDRPVKGWGYDCFRFASGAETYAHNNYLELLADGGIPAVLLFYAPIASVMIRSFIKAKESAAARLGASLMLMLFVLGIASVSYYDRVDLLLIPFASFALGFRIPKKESV